MRVNISDVRDAHSMRYLGKEQNYLFNLAGQTNHMDSMENPYADLEINDRAQLSILEICWHYNLDIKIVFVKHSSDLWQARLSACGRKASAASRRCQ